MTYEELKAEADKLGYGLIKRKEYVKFKPCPKCGSTGNRDCWHRSSVGPFYVCKKCRWKAKPAKTMAEAKRNWNDGIGDEEDVRRDE